MHRLRHHYLRSGRLSENAHGKSSSMLPVIGRASSCLQLWRRWRGLFLAVKLLVISSHQGFVNSMVALILLLLPLRRCVRVT